MEDPAAVEPIDFIDRPVEVVAKSVVSPDPEPIVDSGPAFSPVGEVCNLVLDPPVPNTDPNTYEDIVGYPSAAVGVGANTAVVKGARDLCMGPKKA